MDFIELKYNDKTYTTPSQIIDILKKEKLYWLIDSETDKAIIEIKPLRETQEPKRTKGKSNKTLISETLTYVKNQAKWEAAREFCKDNLIEFRVMTEKELGI
jgi:hypothetical protein